SRWRAVTCARTRLATLAHATSSRNATAASIVSKLCLASPTSDSCSGVAAISTISISVTFSCLSCLPIALKSARACSSEAPSRNNALAVRRARGRRRVRLNRQPDLHFVGKVEPARHDADDRVAHIADAKRRRRQIHSSAKQPPPISIAHHRDRTCAELGFFLEEAAPDFRLRAQHPEEILRDVSASRPNRLAAAQDRD